MRLSRLAALLFAASLSGGCFQMTTIMKLQGDGSGTIQHRMLFTTQALQQLRNFAMLGGGRGSTLDPTSEQQARDMAATLGPGVTYVSSEPITTPAGQGRDATYAFADVNQLRVATQPAAPGGATIRAGGLSTDGQTLTFSLTREAGGNAVLHINVPQPALIDALQSNAVPAQQISMVKSMLAGAMVHLAVEPAGTLVQTSSPYVDGQRVVLLDIDLDEALKDETLLTRLQDAKSADEMKAIIAAAPGLKVNLDKEITIEFTPK